MIVQVTKGLLATKLAPPAVYAIRCANPNYSFAQHLADSKTPGSCLQQNLASSKAAWDYVVLQARKLSLLSFLKRQQVKKIGSRPCRPPSRVGRQANRKSKARPAQGEVIRALPWEPQHFRSVLLLLVELYPRLQQHFSCLTDTPLGDIYVSEPYNLACGTPPAGKCFACSLLICGITSFSQVTSLLRIPGRASGMPGNRAFGTAGV